jgi:dTDP-4-dehydrorhamnose reductase
MTTFCVIGGSGALGSYLVREILGEKQCSKVIYTFNNNKLSIASSLLEDFPIDFGIDKEKTLFLIKKIQNIEGPVIVFFLAAVSHPDVVEKDLKHSEFINCTLPTMFAESMKIKEKDIKFLFSSTDMVYGESENNYYFSENDGTSCINAYAKQKAQTEQIVLDAGGTVFRHTFMFGPSLEGKNTFYSAILDSLLNQRLFDLFCDNDRNFIDFSTTAKVMLAIAKDKKNYGILNVCGDERLSKYDLGILLAKKYNLPSDCLRKVFFKDDTNIYIAKRPQVTLMKNDKLKSILGIKNLILSV